VQFSGCGSTNDNAGGGGALNLGLDYSTQT